MTKKLLQSILLFSAIYVCGISAAFADLFSCTHSPETLSLYVGQSKNVTYTCNTPSGMNYSLTFGPNPQWLPVSINNDIIINSFERFAHPSFVVEVIALQPGSYSLPVTFINIGEGGFVPAVDDNGAPLSVTVPPS